MPKKCIGELLTENPVDWEKVKKRAKRHPKEISGSVFHQLCLRPSLPPPLLEWVLKQPNASMHLMRKSRQGRNARAYTPLELCFNEPNIIPHSTVVRVAQASRRVMPHYFPFSATDFQEMDLSLLEVLLETYDTQTLERHMEDYLFDYEYMKPGDLKFEDAHESVMVNHLRLVLQTAGRLWGAERTSNGVFCALHTFFVIIKKRKPCMEAFTNDVIFILPFLLPIFGHESELKDDQEGNTLLHYIMMYFPDNSRQLLAHQEERHMASSTGLPPTPCCSLVANKRGLTPLHISLIEGYPLSEIILGHDLTPAVAETTYQGLFLFQLAATTKYRTPCHCDYCTRRARRDRAHTKKDADYESPVVVSNIYSLLRMAPHLLSSSSIAVDNGVDAGLLDCPTYKQIVLEELQVARMCRRIHTMKKRRLEEFGRERRRVMAKMAK